MGVILILKRDQPAVLRIERSRFKTGHLNNLTFSDVTYDKLLGSATYEGGALYCAGTAGQEDRVNNMGHRNYPVGKRSVADGVLIVDKPVVSFLQPLFEVN